jgi:hypothetical protein
MSDMNAAICTTLEMKWYTLIEQLKTFKEIPKKILAYLKKLYNGILKKISDTLMNKVLSVIDYVKKLLSYKNKRMSSSDNLCALLYQCDAAFKELGDVVASNFSDTPGIDKVISGFRSSGFKDEITGITFATGYDAFEYYACKLSLKTLAKKKVDDIANNILKGVETLLDTIMTALSLESIMDYLLTDPDFRWWILKTKMLLKAYDESLTGVIGIMNDLNDFVNCGFAICDFASSSQNVQESVAKDFFLEKKDDGEWKLNKTKAQAFFTNSLTTDTDLLKAEVNNAKALINNDLGSIYYGDDVEFKPEF